METRNIQKTGGSSFVVTLPKSWITQQQLEDKDVLEIHEFDGGRLLIQTHKKKPMPSGVLNITYLSDHYIERELIGMYVSGVEEIRVIAKTITYEQRALVRSVSYKLFGLELFEESRDQIVLKNVTSSTISAREYCRKMSDMVGSMFMDIIQVVENQDRKLAKDIVERDVEVDRIHLVIIRQFNRRLYTMVPETESDLPLLDLHYYEHVAIRLERIADHIVRMASTISLFVNTDKVTLNKFEHAHLVQLNEYFVLLKTIIANVDKQKAHKVIDLFETRQKNEYMSPKNITKSAINILIEDSTERIRGYIANIAEETINYTNVKQIYTP